MIIPVRCFSCGKPIGHLYEEYKNLLKMGKSSEEALDILNIERYCCRRMIVSNVELADKIRKYKNPV